MNRKEIEKDLAEVRSQIREADSYKNELLNRESTVKKDLAMIYVMDSPQISAANLWCKITNALIAKYKPLSESNPEEAVKQLLMIQGALLAGGFLTEQELKEAL